MLICLSSILLHFLTIYAFVYVGASLFLLAIKHLFILLWLKAYNVCMACLFCMHVHLSWAFCFAAIAIRISAISSALNFHVKCAHYLCFCSLLIIFNLFVDFSYPLDLYIWQSFHCLSHADQRCSVIFLLCFTFSSYYKNHRNFLLFCSVCVLLFLPFVLLVSSTSHYLQYWCAALFLLGLFFPKFCACPHRSHFIYFVYSLFALTFLLVSLSGSDSL